MYTYYDLRENVWGQAYFSEFPLTKTQESQEHAVQKDSDFRNS